MSLLALLAGCATYSPTHRYRPSPAEADVQPADAPGKVEVLASIIGVRYARKGAPATVEVRIRLDNRTNGPVVVNTSTLSLYSADLQAFESPQVDASDPLTIAPGQAAVVTAAFPFPRGVKRIDMDGLNLRWTMRVGDLPIDRSVTFTRREPVAAYPQYDPYFDWPYHHYHHHPFWWHRHHGYHHAW